ncbi:hypothetical protein JCM19232_2662 [Vibrio ishigakensis]|uniref:Uncharacterized protein n=1 Tax=Vibrio ishigakensis TaxID=1481914 RepID=A0A0B8PGD3_9VIBR|nr:hypothetical protein JCM19232_2662 [Vibrio ishigakensis]
MTEKDLPQKEVSELLEEVRELYLKTREQFGDAKQEENSFFA